MTALALVCALTLAACAPLFPGEAEGPFDGDWLLVQAGWGEAQFTVAGAGITLVSDGESASGFSGCRQYAYAMTGEAEDFGFGDPLEPGPTADPYEDMLPCNGSLERIESRYLSVLLAAERAEVRGDELLLTAGNSYLFFKAFPPFPGPQLMGKQWVLNGYGDTWQDRWTTDVIGSPTLRFLSRDRFVGTLGCGGIAGTYRILGTEVFVTSLHRYGADGCLSAFSEQDQLLAQFLDGFRVIVVGDEHLVLAHRRLQLMYRALPAE
ncbi:hypothetical protein ACFFGH_12020 [Lysobacter korlensis]|uniref:DUF306 domain-containing protein n=1 Tax=Lysobacter korlensis TaxID=553636 RepID=A0ABV6RNM7_9GAMM